MKGESHMVTHNTKILAAITALGLTSVEAIVMNVASSDMTDSPKSQQF